MIVKSVDVFYIDSSEFVLSGGLNLSWHMYVPKSSCSNTVRVGFNADSFQWKVLKYPFVCT